MPARRVLARGAGVLGLVAGAVGVGVLSSPAAAAPAVGWFAYSPLAENPVARLVVVDGVRAAGVALVGLGLALVAFALGLLVHRGRGPARRGVAALAALAVVAGAVVLAVPGTAVTTGGGPPHPMSGEPSTWTFPTVLWTPAQVGGAALALLGVVVLAGAVGASLSRRVRA